MRHVLPQATIDRRGSSGAFRHGGEQLLTNQAGGRMAGARCAPLGSAVDHERMLRGWFSICSETKFRLGWDGPGGVRGTSKPVGGLDGVAVVGLGGLPTAHALAVFRLVKPVFTGQ